MDVLDELLKNAAGASPPTYFADRQEESAYQAQMSHDPYSMASDPQERSAIAAERARKAYVPKADRQEQSAMAAEASHWDYTDRQERSAVAAAKAHEASKLPFSERFWKTFTGGVKSTAAAYTNNACNALYGEAERQRQQMSGEISAWQDTINAYRGVTFIAHIKSNPQKF